MIELMKEMGECKLDDSKLKKYAIINSQASPELTEIYDQLKTGVMELWDKQKNQCFANGYAEAKIINNQQHLLPYITIQAKTCVKPCLINTYSGRPALNKVF